jgi:hypothetical protein
MYGVWGATPDYVVFGGNDEATSRYLNGTMLLNEVTGLTDGNTLTYLYGNSSSDIWSAVDDIFITGSAVYHFNGTNWVDVSPAGGVLGSSCSGIWTEDAGVALVVCDQGLWEVTTQHDAGRKIDTSVGTAEYHGVWGIPGGPAWAVGGDGLNSTTLIAQRSGSTWTPGAIVINSSDKLQAINGRNDHDAWAVGGNTLLMHLDDAGWHVVAPLVGSHSLNGVSDTTSGEAWITYRSNGVMVVRTDGGQETFVPPGIPASATGSILFNGVKTFDNGDLWLTATTDDGGSQTHGAIFHYLRE